MNKKSYLRVFKEICMYILVEYIEIGYLAYPISTYVFHLHSCVPRPLALKKGLSFYVFFHCLVTMVYELIVKCVWQFFFYQYMLETAVICHRVQTVALTIVS